MKPWPSRLLSFLVLALLLSGFTNPPHIHAESREIHHIVVLGDPHIPGRYLPEKEQVIDTLNQWKDVDFVVAVGDITEELGSDGEYAAATKFFARLSKPFIPIPGNHDYLYQDEKSMPGAKLRAKARLREEKLAQFQKTFGLPDRYFTKTAGKYLLIFLATDEPRDWLLAMMSKPQLAWLEETLENNRQTPTIIFFHAPLKGSLQDYNENANTENFVAQPHGRIETLLKQNPQVMLWVSGHTHTSPREDSFASDLNRIGLVTNIHTTDMNRQHIWTNSLLLYPEKIVVKTYDHKKGAWAESLQRTFAKPSLR